jgi:hypothetical protein
MLTKSQTLWALPILIAIFAALSFVGYASEQWFSIRNGGLTAVIGTALVANLLALVFVLLSIFLSFGTALIFNAASPETWQRIGNPFHYLLWRELRETTALKPNARVE